MKKILTLLLFCVCINSFASNENIELSTIKKLTYCENPNLLNMTEELLKEVRIELYSQSISKCDHEHFRIENIKVNSKMFHSVCFYVEVSATGSCTKFE